MISFQNFSFRYEESKDFTLRGIDMTVQTGEFILLTGRSGCGKTTLIRSLNGLIPHFYPGEIQGDLLMDGHSLLEMKPSELAGQVGTVFQDPRSQFFMTDTTRELAFGCENLGLPREETIDRIAKAAKELELVDYLNRSIFALSSGEKQQIAIGSVYALGPKVYIFDEPSANLDYAATKRLAEIMGKLKHAGYTIFVVEHRFYYLRDLIDRAFLIQNGKIEHEFTREQFCSLPEETRISYGLRTAYPERDAEHYQEKPHTKDETHRLEVHNLSFAYKKGPDIFHNVSFEAHAGDVIGILGHNGAGKTTLLSILTGLLKQQRGEVCFDGKKLTPRQRRALSYLVMQDTDYQLFASSVEEELSLGMKDDCKEKVDETLKALELSDYRERHPASLSGGQKQRVTIGAAIVKGSPVIYFDEPTSGLDYDSMVRVSKLIEQLSSSGVIVFVVSHDFEFIVRTCTEVVQLDDDGAIQNQRLYVLGVLLFVFDLFGPLKALYGEASRLTVMNAALDRIEAVLDEPELSDNGKQHIPAQAQPGQPEVQFNDVTFAYQDKEVLHHISFAMKKNSMTALVGPSGSGKSTIANLLARLWDVKSGNVTIRGVDIRNVPLSELMDQISMVFQRVYLFQDTIYNNISMGKPDATEEEVYEAARKARCYDFIMALPDGFKTVVGEGGATLSGGEKQRISIARCILKDAPIVILDEATASVDTDNESYIQEAISELVKGKTLLVIAHRLNTIQTADQILVIDNGQIAQQGNHEELLKQPGIYQDFVNIRKSAAGWSLA